MSDFGVFGDMLPPSLDFDQICDIIPICTCTSDLEMECDSLSQFKIPEKFLDFELDVVTDDTCQDESVTLNLDAQIFGMPVPQLGDVLESTPIRAREPADQPMQILIPKIPITNIFYIKPAFNVDLVHTYNESASTAGIDLGLEFNICVGINRGAVDIFDDLLDKVGVDGPLNSDGKKLEYCGDEIADLVDIVTDIVGVTLFKATCNDVFLSINNGVVDGVNAIGDKGKDVIDKGKDAIDKGKDVIDKIKNGFGKLFRRDIIKTNKYKDFCNDFKSLNDDIRLIPSVQNLWPLKIIEVSTPITCLTENYKLQKAQAEFEASLSKVEGAGATPRVAVVAMAASLASALYLAI